MKSKSPGRRPFPRIRVFARVFAFARAFAFALALCAPIDPWSGVCQTASVAKVASAGPRAGAESGTATVTAVDPPPYEWRTPHDPDGIGKFFLGREIAQVMGHPGADWLERPERESEETPDAVVMALKLRPGDRVADLGAGTGYFSVRLARAVGPTGIVYGVEIQPEMLALLAENLRRRGVTNVVPVTGTITDPRLPAAALDLVLLVDVYHELSHPVEVMAGVRRALKPGGRVAFVEYRAEDTAVPIKPLHKMSEAQVRREAAAHGLVWVETFRGLSRQHLLVFRAGERD